MRGSGPRLPRNGALTGVTSCRYATWLAAWLPCQDDIDREDDAGQPTFAGDGRGQLRPLSEGRFGVIHLADRSYLESH